MSRFMHSVAGSGKFLLIRVALGDDLAKIMQQWLASSDERGSTLHLGPLANQYTERPSADRASSRAK